MLSKEALEYHIEGCIKNQRESQKEIYSAFYGYAMSICLRYVPNQEEVVEVLNDGFLKIFKEIFHYQPTYTNTVGSFTGWIRKIMIFTSIDHYRKTHRKIINLELTEAYNQLNNQNESAIDRLSFNDIIETVQQLSPVYKNVLNLFVIDGLSHQEISKLLGISIGASKSSLFKAKKQLQNLLIQKNKIKNATS